MDSIEKALYDLCGIPEDERPAPRKGSKTDVIAIYPDGERRKIVRLKRGWQPDHNVYCDLLKDAIAYHDLRSPATASARSCTTPSARSARNWAMQTPGTTRCRH